MSGVEGIAAVPRVLTMGLTPEEAEVVRLLAGSVRAITSLGQVHPEEHDVLIAAEGTVDREWEFSRRLVFAKEPDPPKPAGFVDFGGSAYRPTEQSQYKPARDFVIGGFVAENGLSSLVERTCVPITRTHPYRGFYAPLPAGVTHAFVTEHLDSPLALAALVESGEDAESRRSTFWLPQSARSGLGDWIRFAFAWWRRTAPELFPVGAAWRQADRWASVAELEARDALRVADLEEQRRRAAAGRARELMLLAVADAEDTGSAWRRLLDGTGEELVAAVADALRTLGFTVVDADALPKRAGKKREDLQVRDGDWVALVEVKGFRGAAKSNDLQQVTAAGMQYVSASGSVPDALWYVTNSFREVDPAQRETALASRDEDLAAFSEHHHGCLIDTRDLFTLRQRVALGDLEPDLARESLKKATQRYRLTE